MLDVMAPGESGGCREEANGEAGGGGRERELMRVIALRGGHRATSAVTWESLGVAALKQKIYR